MGGEPAPPDSLAAHDDYDLKRYGPEPAIASVSFGAARDFVLKRKDGSATITYSLGGGAMLLMAGKTQTYWTHEVPKRANSGGRVNLTFRSHIGGSGGGGDESGGGGKKG